MSYIGGEMADVSECTGEKGRERLRKTERDAEREREREREREIEREKMEKYVEASSIYLCQMVNY